MGGVACLRGDAKIRIVCPVFRRRKTFFDHISRLFQMYECIHRSKWSAERSASIEYGYMKQFFGILPLDVKIGSDTTYYHFNCGPLYVQPLQHQHDGEPVPAEGVKRRTIEWRVCVAWKVVHIGTVPSSCYPAPAAGRFGARESYYRLCVASTTSAAMRRAIETPRDTDQWGQTTWLMGGASFCTRHKSYTRLRIGSAAPTEVHFMSGRTRRSMTRGGDR